MDCFPSPTDKPTDTIGTLSERVTLWLGPALFLAFLVAPWVETTLTRGQEIGFIASMAATLSGSRDPSITAPFLVSLSQLGILAVAIALIARMSVSARSAVWILIIFGILVRGVLVGLEISGDEAASWITYISPGPTAAFTGGSHAPRNNILYSLIAALTFRFTESQLAVQWMTIFVSIAAVWGANRLMEELKRPLVERLLVMSFLTTSVLAVQYSFRFRGYGPLITCTIFLLAAFLKACRSGKTTDWTAVSIWSALVVGFHLFGVFVPIYLFIWAFSRGRFRGKSVNRQQVFHSAALFTLLLLVMLSLLLPDLVWYFFRRGSSESYSAFNILDFLRYFFGSGFSAGVALAVTAGGILRLARDHDWEIIGILLGPLLLAVGFVVSLDLFSFGRFFLFALPSIAVLGSIGAAGPFLWLKSRFPGGSQFNYRAPTLVAVLVVFSAVWLSQSWRGLDRFFERSHAAIELQSILAEFEGTEILVAGRFYPLVKFYVPRSVPLRKLRQLDPTNASYVVVFDQRDTKWIARYSDLVEELEESHLVVWKARPYATKWSHFRGTVVLRRGGGADPG